MTEKQWEPLTTPEAVIEAIKAGRHVEFTFCGTDYESQGGGWIVPLPDRSEPDGVREAFRLGGGRRYRALIAPAQPAADAKPMNILEETLRILHGEEYRGMHPDVDRLLRALARLKPVACVQKIAVAESLPFSCLNSMEEYDPETDHALYILEPTND